jgi:hypothetical protein
MSDVTSIGDARTPATEVEITDPSDTGLADRDPRGPAHWPQARDFRHRCGERGQDHLELRRCPAAQTEAEGYWGAGTEIVKMVVAAVKANEGSAIRPPLKGCGLASTDTGFGTSDAALTAVKRVKAEFVVSPVRRQRRDHARQAEGGGERHVRRRQHREQPVRHLRRGLQPQR